MSDHATHGEAAGPSYRRMRARSKDEAHRASTPLELFFDLCFVVAVAQAASHLEHAVLEGQTLHAVTGYVTVFFAIWWAWMNFTWFASAFDCDDVVYRLLTFVQIIGVLVLAAGVPRAFDDGNYAIVTVGYLVMRVALVSQWLRSASEEPVQRATSTRYAIGISLCMIGWLLLLVVPQSIHGVGFLAMIVAELLVPAWAERAGRTSWHPGHIAERYGLFTLIVLGESVAASTYAFQSAFGEVDFSAQLLWLLLGGPLIIFSMWWLYFAKSAQRLLTDNRKSFLWGYGHYLIFGSAAAVGAGLAASLAELSDAESALPQILIGFLVTIPVAIYTATVFLLHLRPHQPDRALLIVFGVGCLTILLSTYTSEPVFVTGVILVVLVVTGEWRAVQQARDSTSGPASQIAD